MAGWFVRVVVVAVASIAFTVVGYDVFAGGQVGVILSDLDNAPINVVTDYLP